MSGERTIVFVDLAGFTALTEAYGDAAAVASLAAGGQSVATAAAAEAASFAVDPDRYLSLP